MTKRLGRYEARVKQLLRECEVAEAPVDVNAITKHLNIRVKPTSFDRDDISGFLHRSGDEAVIGVNREHARTRRRFTIAHEIGHFILHKAGIDEVHVDSIKLRSSRSSEGTDREEIEANAFAAELLMPTAFLLKDADRVDLEDEKAVEELSRSYGVSTQAMSFRLTNLGLIK
ncbi:MAG: ImmA/IrrE family metallo-endopeptidase [Gemmataceae bacterium]